MFETLVYFLDNETPQFVVFLEQIIYNFKIIQNRNTALWADLHS